MQNRPDRRTARFCNLFILPKLNPQFKRPYWRCGNISEVYISLKVF